MKDLAYASQVRLAFLLLSLAFSTACVSCSGGGGSSSSTPTPTASPTEAGTPEPTGPWVLFWSDEFDGGSGTLVDATKWVTETGGGGFGNNELQYYTNRAANASTNGAGSLAIQAIEEAYTGPDGVTRSYTSARLNTKGKFEQKHGKFEARLKITRGQGVWPAFWMLGNDIDTVPWPRCGEIDIMENIGSVPDRVVGSLHGPGYSGAAPLNASYSLPGGGAFADDFHVYAIEWEGSVIRWSVDGTLYQTRTPAELSASQEWVFEHPFFMIMNVAVGGNWPGSPDATTVFPQTMLVDYVRVYRRS